MNHQIPSHRSVFVWSFVGVYCFVGASLYCSTSNSVGLRLISSSCCTGPCPAPLQWGGGCGPVKRRLVIVSYLTVRMKEAMNMGYKRDKPNVAIGLDCSGGSSYCVVV